MAITHTNRTIDQLIHDLRELRESALALERDLGRELAEIPPDHQPSARNLIHYLAVRQHDVREIQDDLAKLGLSSLGRLEPHTLACVDSVLTALARLCDPPLPVDLVPAPPVDFRTGTRLLAEHTEALLGPAPKGRSVRVMVTMSSEAADDPALVRDLVAAGMDVMRINCAHDDAKAWRRMVDHLRRAEREVGRPCRVECDLAGPKLRTGPVEPGPGVLHVWPLRDDAGQILAPGRVWIQDTATPSSASGPVLPLDGALLRRLEHGDELRFNDVRGRPRSLAVLRMADGRYCAEADRNIYVGSQTRVNLYRSGAFVSAGTVGEVPPVSQALRLAVGDALLLTSDVQMGQPAATNDVGVVLRPAMIGCTLPEVFADVRPKERVFFDDGKLGGIVREVSPEGLRIEITHARSGKGKLRSDRGINFPDTEMHLSALTQKDREDLDFVVAHADMVGLSFLRKPEDVDELLAALKERHGGHLGVVLKIETRRAFEELPRFLLQALRSPRIGVMVARGDLGVEMGFSRLAEVQEEMLWLCEAAHVPVIWATQVLESLAKKGMPSRAEVTDAAMSGRAECVMLNKGPYVVEAVRFLCDILQRMEGHAQKKRSMLRRLGVSQMR
ncbi:MAG TPA: pyruvate kinase [Deltaproteobacteria bacterium]|nr:pyruvate kinase [Deltaproteobacteria bacterium]